MKDQKEARTNNEINAETVRVVNAEGKQLGIMPIDEALKNARNQGLDLVEIAPQANPPVCKIIDWGKELYRIKKQEHAAKAKQHNVQVKEIQMRPVTDQHDLDIKLKKAEGFLEKGDKVKFIMKFHGREMTHSDIGMEVMNNIIDQFSDNAQVEKKPVLAGRNIQMVLAPISKKD